MATRDGFEPPTFGFGDQRSARLNYRAIVGGNGEIRTHGRFHVDSFQDCCNQPGSATFPLLGVGLPPTSTSF